MKDTTNTTLGRVVQSRTSRHPGQSGFYLLPNGHDAFVARGVLAATAELSIDAQYYLLHDDLIGRLFLNTLLEAANRGVRVRLLVDDMSLDANKDIGVAALDAHPDVEIRIFNPFNRGVSRAFQFVTRFGEVTRRMHKLILSCLRKPVIPAKAARSARWVDVAESLFAPSFPRKRESYKFQSTTRKDPPFRGENVW